MSQSVMLSTHHAAIFTSYSGHLTRRPKEYCSCDMGTVKVCIIKQSSLLFRNDLDTKMAVWKATRVSVVDNQANDRCHRCCPYIPAGIHLLAFVRYFLSTCSFLRSVIGPTKTWTDETCFSKICRFKPRIVSLYL